MASTDGIESVISEQIKTLIRIKADIASAIVSLGGSVSNNDTFASYADKIRNLDPKKNLDLGTLNITSNGSYSASAEGMDGFSSVTVNVTDTSGGGSGGSGSGGSGSGGSGGSGDGSYEEDLPVYIVTFTNPEDPNFENVEVEVKYGGDAEYTGATPTKEGNYKFVKWDPVPINIQENITCKAIFRNLDAEIEDSWIDICDNCGANYEIGEFKTLPIGAIRWFSQYDASAHYISDQISKKDQHYYNVKVVMQKIAENEDGTTSTWLAKSPITNGTYNVCYPMRVIPEEDLNKAGVHNSNGTGRFYNNTSKYPIMNWKTSDLRKWLQNDVMKRIPDPVKSTIKKVHKVSSGELSEGEATLIGIETVDDLWIPSYGELFGTASNILESEFIDYSDASNSFSGMSGDEKYNSSTLSGYYLRSAPTPTSRNDCYYVVSYNAKLQTQSDCNSRLIRLGFCL